MIDYLKKENFKLRSSAYLLKTDLNEVKLRNAHLSEQYGALHDSDEAVRQHAAEMSNANFKLNARFLDLTLSEVITWNYESQINYLDLQYYRSKLLIYPKMEKAQKSNY